MPPLPKSGRLKILSSIVPVNTWIHGSYCCGDVGSMPVEAGAKGEQEDTRALFAGTYAVLRNPASHREIDYNDASEAIEAVGMVSLLMRILDRMEDRLCRESPG
jgi:hypothetical protein